MGWMSGGTVIQRAIFHDGTNDPEYHLKRPALMHYRNGNIKGVCARSEHSWGDITKIPATGELHYVTPWHIPDSLLADLHQLASNSFHCCYYHYNRHGTWRKHKMWIKRAKINTNECSRAQCQFTRWQLYHSPWRSNFSGALRTGNVRYCSLNLDNNISTCEWHKDKSISIKY